MRNAPAVTDTSRGVNSPILSRYARPSEHHTWQLAREAQRDARVCGNCGAAIPPDAPIALQQLYRGPGAGLGSELTTCLSCATPWIERARPYREACPHCRRQVYRRRFTGRLFCSDRCRWLAASAKRSARRAVLRTKPCAVCSRSFMPPRRDAVTCSPACRQRAYRQRHHPRGDDRCETRRPGGE